MKIQLNNINLPIEHNEAEIISVAAKKSGVKTEDINSIKILRKSIDARRNNIMFNFSVMLDIQDGVRPSSDVIIVKDEIPQEILYGSKKLEGPITIIGAGPAGLFAGYMLAKHGYRPIIFERGECIENRVSDVEQFIETGILNVESNIQFGEGGAGTFSDGKLTTRIHDERCNMVLQILVELGADEEILYLAKPHIGTDKLRNIMVNMRKEIECLGGKIHFNSHLIDINIQNSKIQSIKVNGYEVETNHLILAIGHSARDTYQMLVHKGIMMETKSFAMGVRIEHLQKYINDIQYGRFSGHPALPTADYRLAYNGQDRSCFSFCMCPGGSVVAAASEENGIVVNGMSSHARNGINANSALVVSVTPKDYDGILGGMELQRCLEQAAYASTTGYRAPVQLTQDFLENKNSTALKNVMPTYPIGYDFINLSSILPTYIMKTLGDGIRYFDKKMQGFSKNSVLTGVETRTSAPIRILRNEKLQSANVEGLYPIGEGAGYAGGIMSAAVDGIKCAQQLMKEYMPYN